MKDPNQRTATSANLSNEIGGIEFAQPFPLCQKEEDFPFDI